MQAGWWIKKGTWNLSEPPLPYGPGADRYFISVCVCEKGQRQGESLFWSKSYGTKLMYFLAAWRM